MTEISWRGIERLMNQLRRRDRANGGNAKCLIERIYVLRRHYTAKLVKEIDTVSAYLDATKEV